MRQFLVIAGLEEVESNCFEDANNELFLFIQARDGHRENDR